MLGIAAAVRVVAAWAAAAKREEGKNTWGMRIVAVASRTAVRCYYWKVVAAWPAEAAALVAQTGHRMPQTTVEVHRRLLHSKFRPVA